MEDQTHPAHPQVVVPPAIADTPPAKMKLAWWAHAPLVVAFVFGAFGAAVSGDPYTIGGALARLSFGVLLWHCLGRFFAYIAFRISRRSNLVASITCAFAVALPLFVIATIGFIHGAAAADQQRAFEREMQTLNRSMQERAQAGDLGAGIEEVNRAAAAATELAAASSGKDAAKARVMAGMLHESSSMRLAYEAAMAPAQDPMLLNAATFTTRESIDDRIAKIEGMRRANDAYRDRIVQLPAVVRRLCEKEGIRGGEVEEALTVLVPRHSTEAALRLRNIESELLTSYISHLGILRDSFGQWRLDAVNGQLVFDNDQMSERFNQSITAMEAIVAEEGRAFAAMMKLEAPPSLDVPGTPDAEAIRAAAADPSTLPSDPAAQREARIARAIESAEAPMSKAWESTEATIARLNTYPSVGEFTRREQFTAYVPLLREHAAASAAYRAELEQAPEKVRQALLSEQIDPAEITTMVGEMYPPRQLRVTLEYRAATDALTDAMIAQAEHLSANFGRWTLVRTSGAIRYNDRELAASYRLLENAVQSAAADMQLAAAQAEALFASDQGQGPAVATEGEGPKF